MSQRDALDEDTHDEWEAWVAEATPEELMAQWSHLKDTIKEARRQMEAEQAKQRMVADTLLVRMQEMGDLEQVRKGGYSATVSKTVVPNVQDWDKVYEYIKDNDALYLLERRMLSTAWRELHNAGIEIPGTEASTRVDVSVRNVK